MTQIEQISCSPSLAWPPGELNQYHPSNLLTKRDSVELLILKKVRLFLLQSVCYGKLNVFLRNRPICTFVYIFFYTFAWIISRAF